MHKLAYYENVIHGTSDFPAAYYYVDKHHARYDMPFHWHKEWELIHIAEGSFTLFVDGIPHTAGKGDCFLLPDGVMHGGTPSNNCTYECLVFDLHSCFREISMIKKYIRPFYRNEVTPQIFFSSESSQIVPVILELMSAMQTPLPELNVIGGLCRLFSLILSQHLYTDARVSDSTESRRITLLKPVLEYIEDHYSENLSLDDLADIAGMNSRYFCRIFRSVTKQTPMNYVNSYRIEQASLLLESGEISVTETALQCGFCDPGYFTKCFRKFRGITPKQYKRVCPDSRFHENDSHG